MNNTELKALDWLEKQGYKETDIMRGSVGEPDFICKDGKRFEVKFLYGNRLLFYPKQIADFKNDDIILLFDRDKFITKFLWQDRNKTQYKITEVETKNKAISIYKKDAIKLDKLKIVERDTYAEVIKRLLKNVKTK